MICERVGVVGGVYKELDEDEEDVDENVMDECANDDDCEIEEDDDDEEDIIGGG